MNTTVKKYKTFIISSAVGRGAVNKSPDGSSFQVILDRPIQIPSTATEVELRVLESNIWNVVPNISAEIGNNTLQFSIGGTPYTTIIPDGLYSLDALEEFIQRDLTNKGLDPTAIQFSGNGATQRAVITFGIAGVQIDLTVPNAPTEILGFNPRLVPLAPSVAGQSEEGDFQANFNRTEFFLISTDLISNGIPVNSTSGNGIIHKALIEAPPGSQSNYQPFNPAVVDASELIGSGLAKSQFNIRLTDQLGRAVNTQQEDFSFTMELTYKMVKSDRSHMNQGTRWS